MFVHLSKKYFGSNFSKTMYEAQIPHKVKLAKRTEIIGDQILNKMRDF